MKKAFVMLIFILFLVAGCSSNNDIGSNEHWDREEGYIVAKENGRILIVPNKVENFKITLDEILKASKPYAIWLAVDKSEYDAVEVYDHVRIEINGGIDQSYPEQASGDVVKK